MRESPFGFAYSWSELFSVRALAITVLVFQILGAGLGVTFKRFPDWFESLWFGGAVASFPGFLLGLYIQSILYPGTIEQNRVMLRRLGLVALLLSCAALALPVLGLVHAR